MSKSSKLLITFTNFEQVIFVTLSKSKLSVIVICKLWLFDTFSQHFMVQFWCIIVAVIYRF